MNQDREFEKYLEAKSDLSKLYADLPEVDVPRHLDAAILAEAHRAVNSRPGGKPKRRWVIPLSMAASLFVVVMAGLQLPYMLQGAAKPQQAVEEKKAALLDKNMAKPDFTEPEGIRIKQLAAVQTARSNIESTPVKASPGVAEPTAAMPKTAPAAKAAPQAADSVSDIASPAVVSSPPAKDVRRLDLQEREDHFSRARQFKEKKASAQTEASVPGELEQRPASPTGQIFAQPAKHHLVEEKSLKKELTDANLLPEEWLKRILKLKQEGKVEDFDRELAEFKKRYPNFTVPRDIENR